MLQSIFIHPVPTAETLLFAQTKHNILSNFPHMKFDLVAFLFAKQVVDKAQYCVTWNPSLKAHKLRLNGLLIGV